MASPLRTTRKNTPSNHLTLSASIAAALLSGYGSRQAFALSGCYGSGGTYVCSGAVTTGQSMYNYSGALTVTTTEGFSVATSDRTGLGLHSTKGGPVSFTDNYSASITGGLYGISANSSQSYSSAISITSTGTVTGTSYDGIRADLWYAYASISSITINTAAVSGGRNGINTYSTGNGTTSITSTGTVTGTGNDGIHVLHYGTDISINTAAVSGGNNGIYADNRGSGVNSITSTGTVTGTGNDGVLAFNTSRGTDLTINAAAVSGGRYGINASNSGTGTTSITVSGAVTGGSGAGIYNYNTNSSTITLNSGAAVSSDSKGGAAIIDGIGDTTVTVNTGASVTGSIDLGGGTNEVTLNGGTLNVATGFALTVTGNLTNSTGVINLQNSTIDAAATITGDFTGGGQLLIDADFATDTADTLAITGNVLADGTQVSVNDISSGPATGADITLVSVGGTTAAGDFTLAASVVNGAFDYNALALIGSDWVLQSIAATDAPTSGPVYTPFASSFEAFGQSLLTLETLPSLADRTRNRMSGASSGDDTGIDSPVWVRVAGGKRKIDSTSSTTGADFDTNHWRAQIGADFTLTDNAASRFVAGVNAGYGRAKTEVSATAGNSNLDTSSYSLGLSGTWFIPNGAYVDLQAQKSWYETDLSASGVGAGNVSDVEGDGYSASIEFGRAIALSDALQITPQAQLVYAKVDTDTFTGANAEVVKLTDSKSLKARVGAELDKQFTEDGATHGFVLANVIHEFEDQTQVNVSGAQLVNSVDKWSGELGAGVIHAWDKGSTNYELFAAVTGGTSLNNPGDSNSVQGELGFKARF